jgi:hypothetical protein
MDPRIRIHPKMSWIRNTGGHIVEAETADAAPVSRVGGIGLMLVSRIRIQSSCSRALSADASWRMEKHLSHGRQTYLLFSLLFHSGHASLFLFPSLHENTNRSGSLIGFALHLRGFRILTGFTGYFLSLYCRRRLVFAGWLPRRFFSIALRVLARKAFFPTLCCARLFNADSSNSLVYFVNFLRRGVRFNLHKKVQLRQIHSSPDENPGCFTGRPMVDHESDNC